MKLLTLNTHSLLEENFEKKLEWFVEIILKEKPDIIALQEVNQSMDAPLASQSFWQVGYPARKIAKIMGLWFQSVRITMQLV